MFPFDIVLNDQPHVQAGPQGMVCSFVKGERPSMGRMYFKEPTWLTSFDRLSESESFLGYTLCTALAASCQPLSCIETTMPACDTPELYPCRHTGQPCAHDTQMNSQTLWQSVFPDNGSLLTARAVGACRPQAAEFPGPTLGGPKLDTLAAISQRQKSTLSYAGGGRLVLGPRA